MGKRYEGYKEGFKEGFREGLKEKTGKEIGAELREELEAEVRKELREELVDEVKEELKAELREEVEEGYLREFIEDFKKRFVEGFREEFPKGVQEGRQETLRRLAADGVLTTAQAAKLAGTTEAEFCKKFGLSPEPSNGAASDGASVVDESRAPEENASDGKDADEDETVEPGAILFEIRDGARRIGVEEGRLRTLRQLVVDGVLTIADAADRASESIPAFEMKAVRTEEQWRMEYEAFRNAARDKYERLFSFPGFETFADNAIFAGRNDGVDEGASDVLNRLVADDVLTRIDAGRYVAENS